MVPTALRTDTDWNHWTVEPNPVFQYLKSHILLLYLYFILLLSIERSTSVLTYWCDRSLEESLFNYSAKHWIKTVINSGQIPHPLLHIPHRQRCIILGSSLTLIWMVKFK